MRHPWSYSTTVRNPERLRDFLRVLSILEGQPFNKENQIKFQVLLIQNKLYKPTKLTFNELSYFDDVEKEMPFSVAQTIFDSQNYKGPDMRGRQSANPLNKMGLSVARDSYGNVKITNFGKYFLSNDFDLGQAFFIHFLKWQLPSPDTDSFSEKDGFAIKPFIGTLHLIDKVNKIWQAKGNKPVGISKEEFSLFCPTLIDFKKINEQAEKVVEFREGLSNCQNNEQKIKFKTDYKKAFAEEFLETSDPEQVSSLLDNLKDYGDNVIRYFRLTRYIYIRGGGFYIDLEPRRAIEINTLLASDDASPIIFKSVESYLEYISDIKQPILPWETEIELKAIVKNTEDDVQTYITDLKSKGVNITEFIFKDSTALDNNKLKLYVEELRNYRRELQDLEIHFNSQDIDILKRYIEAFENIYKLDNRPRELERLATLGLNALNDAIAIKPNYPVGDDNEPTFTAPANKPDIECYYENFNGVCEVTMLKDRAQWYNEGQPVMRHVRDFENEHTGKATYCLFIAPSLHTDTMETFWVAIKHGYKNLRQNIIPLSIKQFIEILQVLLQLKQSGKKLSHLQLLNLYQSILALTENVDESDAWLEKIPVAMETWKEAVLQ